MMQCPVCETSLNGLVCPDCDPAMVARLQSLEAGQFPASALPPARGLNPGRAADLRRALLSGDLALAEQCWLVILRGLHGTGAAARNMNADCWQAYAALLDALGRQDEAERMRQRAATQRKDPAELKRKSSDSLDASAQLLRRLQGDGMDRPNAEAVQRVQAELDRQLALQSRREKVIKVGALSLAGLAGGSIMGVPAALTGALGAGLGWAWSRHRF